MHSLRGGYFHISYNAQKTPLSPLRVNHAMDYSIIVPHKLVTDRRFLLVWSDLSPKSIQFPTETNIWEKRQRKSNTFQ